MANPYNLFLSHSWAYSDAYEKLVGMLNSAPRFSYRNYSVPKDDPIHTNGTDTQLYAAIKTQVSFCNVILIVGGIYASHSKWIEKEIRIAKREYSKPVICIKPWASKRVSQIVQDNADQIVGWNTSSIVTAIRNLA